MVTVDHRTFCRLCTAACGVIVTVDGDEVVGVRGDRAHPVSRGYTCVKGRSLGLAHHDDARLSAPLLRRDGELVEVEWSEWFDDLARRLTGLVQAHGPSSVGVFYSGGSYFDASGHRVRDRFISALGTRSIYSSYTLDSPNKPLVAELVGGSVRLSPLPDLESTTFLLVVATNPVISHGHGIAMSNPALELRRIRDRGELWVLDPRHTEAAQLATRHLAPRPGTDYAVLAFLVRELLVSGADQQYLDRHVSDVARLAAAVEPFTIDVAADVTGVAATDLSDLLAAVRRAGRVSVLTGTGASMSRTANVLEWLAWSLGLVTGSLDRPGGTWFNPGFFRQNDRVAPVVAPPEGTVAPGPDSRPDLKGRNNQLPAVAIPDEVHAGNLRAFVAVGANLVAAMPETHVVVDALRRLEVFVVLDVVTNETTALATHVAPCAGQLERADLSTSSEIFQPAVFGQYTPPIVPLGGARRPLWWILTQLARRMGLSVLPPGLDPQLATTDDVLAAMAGDARRPFASVRDADGPVMAEPGPVFGWVADGGVLPDGRWRAAPAPLVEQLQNLRRDETVLVLTPRRERRQMNAYLRFLQQRDDVPECLVHPADANRASVNDGDLVVIGTGSGTMTAIARVDATMRPGVVSVPHAWRTQSVNNLLSCSDDIDPLTGMPLMSGVPVTITRVHNADVSA